MSAEATLVASQAERGARSRTQVRVISILLGLGACALVLYPLGSILANLFLSHGHVTIRPFRDAFGQSSLPKTLFNTLWFVGGSMLLAIFVGCVLAWLAERTDASLGRVGSFIPVVPLFVHPLATAIGWVFLLSPVSGFVNTTLRKLPGIGGGEFGSGPLDINTAWGLLFVGTLTLVPYAYLVLAAAFRDLDPDLEAASRVSGAGLGRTLRRITIPGMRPALLSSLVLLTMMGLALLSVAVIIGTAARIDILSAVIYRVIVEQLPPDLPQGTVLSFLILAVILSMLGLQWLLSRSRRFQPLPGRAKAHRPTRLGIWKWPARLLLVLYILCAVVLPIGALFLVSLQRFWSARIDWGALSTHSYRAIFDNPLIVHSLRNSIFLAAGAAIISVLIGFAVAWGSYQRRRGWIGAAITAVAAIPAGIPHLVFGVGFLLAFSREPFVLYGSSTLLLLAYVTIWLPQATQAAGSGVRRVGRDMIEASQIAGASEWRTIARIALPLAFPQLVSGLIIVFVLTMGELNASVMLTTPTNNTAGPQIFALWITGDYPAVAALSLVLCGINAAAMLVLSLVGRRARGSR
jgi:iron(III) transport system permease protein